MEYGIPCACGERKVIRDYKPREACLCGPRELCSCAPYLLYSCLSCHAVSIVDEDSFTIDQKELATEMGWKPRKKAKPYMRPPSRISHADVRKQIDKLKHERDCAEHTASEAKREGGPDNRAAYNGATERAGIINRLMKHRGE